MKKICLSILAFLLIAISSNSQNTSDFNFKWKNGFVLSSYDKQFNLKFGGRIQVDHAFFSNNSELENSFGVLNENSASEFRRARIFMSGTVYNNVNFKLQFDFAGGKTVLKDAYIGIKAIPGIGNLRVGHMKEPFSLDALTSSKYNTFMERSLPNMFTFGRNNGVLFFNDFYNKALSIQAGLFRESDNTNGNFKLENNGYSFTSRITSLLLNDANKNQLIHIGAAYSYRKPDQNSYSFSSRPEAHLSSFKYLSTGTISDINSINAFNFELAIVSSSFALQAEYFSTNISSSLNGINNISFNGYYAQLSYYLTGESKSYKNSYSGFGRVSPKKDFGKKNAYGSWEIALRYSWADLNSYAVNGGEQSDITLGVNWLLNPATRFTINNVWADVKGLGKAYVFQLRFQIDF